MATPAGHKLLKQVSSKLTDAFKRVFSPEELKALEKELERLLADSQGDSQGDSQDDEAVVDLSLVVLHAFGEMLQRGKDARASAKQVATDVVAAIDYTLGVVAKHQNDFLRLPRVGQCDHEEAFKYTKAWLGRCQVALAAPEALPLGISLCILLQTTSWFHELRMLNEYVETTNRLVEEVEALLTQKIVEDPDGTCAFLGHPSGKNTTATSIELSPTMRIPKGKASAGAEEKITEKFKQLLGMLLANLSFDDVLADPARGFQQVWFVLVVLQDNLEQYDIRDTRASNPRTFYQSVGAFILEHIMLRCMKGPNERSEQTVVAIIEGLAPGIIERLYPIGSVCHRDFGPMKQMLKFLQVYLQVEHLPPGVLPMLCSCASALALQNGDLKTYLDNLGVGKSKKPTVHELLSNTKTPMKTIRYLWGLLLNSGLCAKLEEVLADNEPARFTPELKTQLERIPCPSQKGTHGKKPTCPKRDVHRNSHERGAPAGPANDSWSATSVGGLGRQTDGPSKDADMIVRDPPKRWPFIDLVDDDTSQKAREGYPSRKKIKLEHGLEKERAPEEQDPDEEEELGDPSAHGQRWDEGWSDAIDDEKEEEFPSAQPVPKQAPAPARPCAPAVDGAAPAAANPGGAAPVFSANESALCMALSQLEIVQDWIKGKYSVSTKLKRRTLSAAQENLRQTELGHVCSYIDQAKKWIDGNTKTASDLLVEAYKEVEERLPAAAKAMHKRGGA